MHILLDISKPLATNNKYLTMYKGCAPRISELVADGRKRHQVRYVDNQQQSSKNDISNLSKIGQKRLIIIKMRIQLSRIPGEAY